MKINSKGYIEPEVGVKFKINANGNQAQVKTLLFDLCVNTCDKCIFYNENNCIFPCLNEERDDNNQVIYKEIKDE